MIEVKMAPQKPLKEEPWTKGAAVPEEPADDCGDGASRKAHEKRGAPVSSQSQHGPALASAGLGQEGRPSRLDRPLACPPEDESHGSRGRGPRSHSQAAADAR